MDVESVKNFIKEMFKDLNDEEIDHLIKTTPDLDSIVTKILNNDHKGFTINLKDLVINYPKSTKKQIPELYYPELFNNSYIDENINILELREQSAKLYQKTSEFKKKHINYQNKVTQEYYDEETTILIEKAKKIDKKVALVLAKKALKNKEMIDLHGFYVKEALMFLSDYIKIISPKNFGVITGRDKGSNGTLRPSVIHFLKKHNYIIEEVGPCLLVKKRNM